MTVGAATRTLPRGTLPGGSHRRAHADRRGQDGSDAGLTCDSTTAQLLERHEAAARTGAVFWTGAQGAPRNSRRPARVPNSSSVRNGSDRPAYSAASSVVSGACQWYQGPKKSSQIAPAHPGRSTRSPAHRSTVGRLPFPLTGVPTPLRAPAERVPLNLIRFAPA